MAGAQTAVERLRQFLRELSPGARSLLIGELERCVLRGEDVSGAELVLQELRRIVRDQREGGPRIENSARLYSSRLSHFSSTTAATTGTRDASREHHLSHCGTGSVAIYSPMTLTCWPMK